jgi:hypothetical protein
MRTYWKATEEGLNRTPWRIRCVTGCGLGVRQTTYGNDDVVAIDDDDDDDT